jgi:hypothetical protein
MGNRIKKIKKAVDEAGADKIVFLSIPSDALLTNLAVCTGACETGCYYGCANGCKSGCESQSKGGSIRKEKR